MATVGGVICLLACCGSFSRLVAGALARDGNSWPLARPEYQPSKANGFVSVSVWQLTAPLAQQRGNRRPSRVTGICLGASAANG